MQGTSWWGIVTDLRRHFATFGAPRHVFCCFDVTPLHSLSESTLGPPALSHPAPLALRLISGSGSQPGFIWVIISSTVVRFWAVSSSTLVGPVASCYSQSLLRLLPNPGLACHFPRLMRRGRLEPLICLPPAPASSANLCWCSQPRAQTLCLSLPFIRRPWPACDTISSPGPKPLSSEKTPNHFGTSLYRV